MYKERVANLMDAVKDSKDTLEFVESRMNTFTSYVTHIIDMEARLQRLRAEGVRGEDWQMSYEIYDTMRRRKHNTAMDSISQLNRLSKDNGLEPFYDGPVDDEHRNQVGDIIGDIVNEYFKGRYVRQLRHEDLISDSEKLLDKSDETDDFTQAIKSIPESASSVEK